MPAVGIDWAGSERLIAGRVTVQLHAMHETRINYLRCIAKRLAV
jgi:hypothetical protein